MRVQGDKFSKATGGGLSIAPESPLIEPYYVNEGHLVIALSILMGDDDDSISWFVYECDYGREPMRAGNEDRTRLIDSLENLRWLIELKGAKK